MEIEKKITMEEMKNYKQNFCQYMLDNGLKESTAVNYLSGIESVDCYIRERINDRHISLYSIIDVDILENIQTKLKSEIDFRLMNAKKSNQCTAAFAKYLDFAKSMQVDGVSDKSVDDVDFLIKMERLKLIDKAIQNLNELGTEVPYSLLKEKEEIENRYWREKMSVEIADMLNEKYRNLGCKISLCINYPDEDGWRVVTDK